MSNIRMSIDISGIKNSDGSAVVISDSIVADMLLNPQHATVEDIGLYFYDDVIPEVIRDKIYQVIFNKSIWIDQYLLRKKINITPEELFMLKRDYVICASLIDTSKILFLEIAKDVTVEKRLGDFSVKKGLKTEPIGIDRIGKDAAKCVKDLLGAIDDMCSLIMEGFVKGQDNPFNKRSDREWDHPSFMSPVPIAANKISRDNSFYKTGQGHGSTTVSTEA